MNQLPKTCLIGAGSSGIAAAKALRERGIPFDCFEKSDRVGGNWVFGNNNGMSAAYRSLHINTSKRKMQFSDFPMPDSYPHYPGHEQIAEYFENYVDKFGIRDSIQFETGVERADRLDDGSWQITLDNGETQICDALVVANGHHWDPRWPEPGFAGHFDGIEMHAHAYVDNKEFEGKNVAVVGMGNSAMDIAVETSFVSEKTFLVARSGVHVVPKYAFGVPVDHLEPPFPLPWPAKQFLLEMVLKLASGSVEQYGLPKPTHRFGEAHPTVSADILNRVGHGEVLVKPNIAELMGDRVRFEDGSVAPVDTIVYCTGYKVTFPFFDPNFLSAPDNDLPLFKRIFKPDVPNVFFVGLIQPLGAIMPLAEEQSRLIADHLSGRYNLPSDAEMAKTIRTERKRMFKRYVKSKRHTMQVDFTEYLSDLRAERKRGAERAQAVGTAAPAPARANVA